MRPAGDQGGALLQTNAILITPAHVEALVSLKDRGLFIQTSLEGNAAVHDPGRGRREVSGRPWRGCTVLRKSGMASQICITFTEMQHNFEDIPDLLKMADDMGIGQFVTGTLVPGGRAAQPGGLAPPTSPNMSAAGALPGRRGLQGAVSQNRQHRRAGMVHGARRCRRHLLHLHRNALRHGRGESLPLRHAARIRRTMRAPCPRPHPSPPLSPKNNDRMVPAAADQPIPTHPL